MRFDQRLEIEHHARPALGVGCGPTRLRFLRSGDGGVEIGLRAELDLGLHRTGVGIEHLARPRGSAAR